MFQGLTSLYSSIDEALKETWVDRTPPTLSCCKAFHSSVRSERTRHRATVRYFISLDPVFIFHPQSYHSISSVCSSKSVCTVNVQWNQDLWRLMDIYWPLCAHFGQGSSLRMSKNPPSKVNMKIFPSLLYWLILI